MSQCNYIQANNGHNSRHKLDNDILTFLMQKRFYVIYEKYFVLKEKSTQMYVIPVLIIFE